jgi:hypothetical protein
MQSSLLPVVLTAALAVSASAQDARPAAPLDPVAGILDAFRAHDIVALGEGAHGNEQGAAFRLALVRDARFATTVNDIVVESGNARYQDVMDRFVRGEDVPADVLRQAITALLRHELTHLFTFQLWGNTAAGPWLVEGLGVWAAGDCQGRTPDEYAAGARGRGELVPLKDLAARFREINEAVAMPQAGSIVGFLIRRDGMASVAERWHRPANPREHPLGPDGVSLERAWLDSLQHVRPAYPDVPRLMKEGC